MNKRHREEQLPSLSTEELVKLVALKNKKSNLLKQLEELDTEIGTLQSKNEEAELARIQAEQHQQMQQMEPFLAKMLSMSDHLEQLCLYTKELSSKVASLENVKSELCQSNAKCELDTESNSKNKYYNSIESKDNAVKSNSIHPLLITNTLQRRCMELEDFTRELTNLQLVLDCTNKNLTDYQTLLKLKKQLE